MSVEALVPPTHRGKDLRNQPSHNKKAWDGKAFFKSAIGLGLVFIAGEVWDQSANQGRLTAMIADFLSSKSPIKQPVSLPDTLKLPPSGEKSVPSISTLPPTSTTIEVPFIATRPPGFGCDLSNGLGYSDAAKPNAGIGQLGFEYALFDGTANNYAEQKIAGYYRGNDGCYYKIKIPQFTDGGK